MISLVKQTLLLMMLSPVLIAQDLSGIVIDEDEKVPLQGAMINIVGSAQFEVADKQGRFSFEKLKSDQGTLIIRMVGYRDKEISWSKGQAMEIGMVSQNILEEVIIRAVRAPADAPTVKTTLQRSQIKAQYWGQDAVLNLERLVPSILAHSEAGSNFANYSLMRLRGIDQTRINITLNGVPLNDMIDQGVFFSNFTDFTNNIESVQVQRGVGTSTNGTASYAGSINYQTLKLDHTSAEAKVQLTTGSFGSLRGSAGYSSGLLNQRWAFTARATKTYSDGYKFNSGTRSHSLFFSGGYFGEKDLLKLTLLAGNTRNELAYLPVWIEDIEIEPRTNYLHPTDEDDFSQQVMQLQHTHKFSPSLNLSSSIYYGGAGGDFPFGFEDDQGNLSRLNFPLTNRHWGAMSALNADLTPDWDLSTGIHGYIFNRDNEEGFIGDPVYYKDDSQKKEFSWFAKSQKQWGPWSMYLDLQLRAVTLELEPDLTFLEGQGVDPSTVRIPRRDWLFINPKVGIAYDLSPFYQLFLSAGRSGREPTRADILGATTINAFNLDTIEEEESVRAEYVNDLELGVNISLPRLKALFNVFYMDFEDEIAPTGEFIPEGFVQLRQNIETSYRTGLELDWMWLATDELSFSGQGTYMKSNVKSFSPGGSEQEFNDVTPILSPKWLFTARLEYRVNKYLNLNINNRYVSESFLELTNQDQFTMPEFLVVNAGATINWKTHQLMLQVNNLFDKQYFTNGAPVDVDFDGIFDGPGYLVQAPLHFFATLRLNFPFDR